MQYIYDLLTRVVCTAVESVSVFSDPALAFDQCDVAILLGGFPRLKGMERSELLSKNVDIMRSQVLCFRNCALWHI